jgi:hypothetical protein
MRARVIAKHFDRRIRKLEALRTDATGLVPHSREWYADWYRQLDCYIAGELNEVLLLLPVEIISGWIAQDSLESRISAGVDL